MLDRASDPQHRIAPGRYRAPQRLSPYTSIFKNTASDKGTILDLAEDNPRSAPSSAFRHTYLNSGPPLPTRGMTTTPRARTVSGVYASNEAVSRENCL